MSPSRIARCALTVIGAAGIGIFAGIVEQVDQAMVEAAADRARTSGRSGGTSSRIGWPASAVPQIVDRAGDGVGEVDRLAAGA